MSRRMKQLAAGLMILAMVIFLGLQILYKKQNLKPVSSPLFERTKAIVDKNPQLQPDWTKAMEDGVLTWPEAKGILDKVGEKAEPEE